MHSLLPPSYPRPSFKLVAERASGVWVEDVDGNVFLDCNAGVAVCSTGHCHPEVVRAIQEQAAQLIHMCGTDYYYRHMPQLAEKARCDRARAIADANSLRKQRHRSSRDRTETRDARDW
jgi:4-aminobutyrate aminotransferase-like enzyme